MAQGINLLPEIGEEQKKKINIKRKINVLAITALLAVAIILFGLFSYQLFLQTSRTRIQRESKNLESQILEKSALEISQRSLVDKLNEIDKILSEAIPISSAVANIRSLSQKSAGVTVTSIDVKADGDVTVTLSSGSSTAIETFIETLISEGVKPIFDEATLTNLSREKGDPFSFTIDMDFQPRGLAK